MKIPSNIDPNDYELAGAALLAANGERSAAVRILFLECGWRPAKAHEVLEAIHYWKTNG
jgi:hypothetical protein